MNVLCLDLTITPGSIALMHNNCITQRELNDQRNQGTVILTEVESLLREESLTISSVDEIWVVTGPGSFTGIRIALATALGLAKPRGLKVHGVTAFASMVCAAMCDGRNFPLWVAQQSHQGDYFSQIWTTKEKVSDPDQGDIKTTDRSLLVRDLGNKENFDTMTVSAQHVLALRDELLAGNFVSDPEPFYIRPPDVTKARNTTNK